MVRAITILSALLFMHITATAQNQISGKIENTTFAATQGEMPFWFWANRHGTVAQNNQYLNLTSLAFSGLHNQFDNNAFSITWGAQLYAGLGNTSYTQFNEAYAGINYKGWLLKAGLFSDENVLGGLSTTNGNMVRSLNARPHPKIRFGTNGFQPLFFAQNWLRFKAEWNEGIMTDNRFVEKPRLHNKALYFKITPANEWSFHLGLELFTMWGGISPEERIGQLPQDIKAYLLYISGSAGDDEFPVGEQLNVAGNHLGTYQFQLTRHFENFNASVYFSHLFEDYSGVNWRNWPDKLYGFHYESNKNEQFISEVVYEFINTRQQSITDSFYYWHEEEERIRTRENDKYFYHYIYKSGFTNHKMLMGNPLFIPQFENDKSMIIPSNRFFAHHLGIKGHINKRISWRGMFTYSHHLGRYIAPFDPPVNKLNTLLTFSRQMVKIPIVIGISAAYDYNSSRGSNFGLGLKLSKTW